MNGDWSTRFLTRSKIATALLLSVIVLPIHSQMSDAQETEVSLLTVRQLRQEAEASTGWPEDFRTQVLELYDIAAGALETAERYRVSAISFETERTGIDRIAKNLSAELEEPDSPPQIKLRADATVVEAEDALARERARLAANRTALRDLERLAEDRSKSRSEISQRLGKLDLELELINDELRSQVESTARTEVKAAARLSALARRNAARAEIEMLRSRLVLLADRSSLIPLEIDLARRRVAFSETLAGLYEEAAHEIRVEKARDSLEGVRKVSRDLGEELPQLASIANETVEMAETLWGVDGIVRLSEEIASELDRTRKFQADFNRIIELTSRKFEAYGHRGSITRWWPDIPDDFPNPAAIARTVQHLDEEIPEVEHTLIVYEQQRATAYELARTTMRDLQSEMGEDLKPELANRVRGLFAERQDLLDQMIQRGGRYSNQLVEYRTVANRFLGHVQEVERFLYAHVLWSRSVPKPIIPQASSIAEAAGWLLAAEHIQAISFFNFDFTGVGLFVGLLLVLIILLRQPMKRRLREIAERIPDPEHDRFRYTFFALVFTCLLASPIPMALYFLSNLLERAGGTSFWFSSANALIELALVTAVLELIRQIFAPSGLAESHFGWPTHATAPLHRGLLISEAVGLPLLYTALHLMFAGMRLDSPDNLQLYNNSLGRLAFIAAMMVLGLSILAMLRPARKLEPAEQEMRVPWPRRFSEYAFPTAFLGAYPIVFLSTLVPAVLAAFGYYVTGLLLAYQMLRTLVLVLVVMVGGGLVHRARIVERNRSLLEQDDGDDQTHQRELDATEVQIRHLFRFAVSAVLIVGLFSIWSDALPMLQLLKRVQLLPRVELLEPIDDTATVLATLSDPATMAESPGEPTETSGTEPIIPVPGGGPSATGAGGESTTESAPLTLWLLLEAILAGLIAMMLVRNLPAVIEITLKRRTTLDTGARFAFSTLVRYSITIIGTIVVFSLLGVTWSKVQWLAAALTFGLGFGLQEIVANFVSGLILLVERPVRVGDVVTIGTLMGRVTRIQIRATTITLWDRSEMIVPNKEFITTKLVNWTLSDSKRRIEIPVRIAYGADLEQVKSILVNAAEQHPSVLDDPAPHVLLLAFGDDAINFELRFVVDFGQGLETKDQVQMAIDRAFREGGIEFALPKSEIRLISESRDENGSSATARRSDD